MKDRQFFSPMLLLVSLAAFIAWFVVDDIDYAIMAIVFGIWSVQTKGI